MPAETQVHYNKQYLQEELRQLANLQQVTLDAKPLEPIDNLLETSRETLVETYRLLARAAKQNRELSSAAEWLIDNFYIIQEQIVQLKEDLPPSYYQKLPRLLQGEYRGFPRTYEIVQMLAAISDNIIDRDNTATAVRAYQEVDTLKLGEMWSVPLMNRLALVVRLAERSEQLLNDRRIQDEAEQLLQHHRIEESDEPGFLLRKLSEIVDQKHDTSNFLVVLAQRLQSRGVLTETERRWFDYKFSRWDTNLEEQLRVRTQRTSRLHLSIQNAISSLREVSETDWSDFVEECAVVERILRLDPAGMYSEMDFSTRDSYRKKVEVLSENSDYSEQEIAEQVLMMAESAAQNGTIESGKKMHVGYYLLDEGYRQLCGKLDYKKTFYERLLSWGEEYPPLYFCFIAIHLIVLLVIVGLFTDLINKEGWIIAITIITAFLPALDLSIGSTNRILSFLIPPRILPKMEFKGKIPHEYRTTVVVPTIFTSPADVEEQFELLEIRALANANPSLQFALLSDFPDAPHEIMVEDEEIMNTAYKQLERLNSRYSSVYNNKFMLFHRKRCWNESEGCWMGWERKRGKLEEFNRLLRDPSVETTYFTDNEELLQSLHDHPVKFVITLDADTKLPPGSAKKLIGTAAHPLNRAEIDESGNFVKKGYGIFQPRISIPPKSANKTWFANIFSGNVGLDPYTTAVSDIYQDLFGEGVYTGKGLYDVDAFQTVLDEHFPENAILSHDLLESTYLRSALVTDIELFDEYPTSYLNYSKRNHRWIRGDWQILYWLFSKVPAPDGATQKNPINGVSKWKIFDNLRRSLNPAALIIFLLLGWTLLPGSALIWTAAVFGIVAFPIYSSFSTDIFRRPERVGWKLYLEKIRADIKMNTIQSVTSFLFLPHQAIVSLDAICRTLYRMFISKKRLLEWTSAIQVERRKSSSLVGYWTKMWFNVFWAVLCLVLVSLVKAPVLIIAIPICLGWILTPALAFLLEKPPVDKERNLKFKEIKELRNYARRTWHYFEQYVNEEQSWLPPDNVQEEPYVGVVGRTSPTNMGLSLLSIFAAYKIGHVTLSKMLELLDNSLSSMLRLERYHGHFYNWYSTRLGEVLNPNYISTVDSGNLAACLIVIQQGLDQLPHERWPKPDFWDGLRDTIEVIDEMLGELKETKSQEGLYEILSTLILKLRDKLPEEYPSDITGWYSTLNRLHQPAKDLTEVNLTILREEFENLKFSDWKDWLSRPLKQIESQLKEIDEYFSINEQERVVSGVKNPEKYQLKSIESFSEKLGKAQSLAKVCQQMIEEMDFRILFDEERELFTIGFNVGHAALDKGTYDLLASEARLASFIAIAKGEVPAEHWFKLSRRLTSIDKNEILLSWSGTMFEYLMPLLFMARYDRTLLSNTYDHVVDWQKDYGHIRRKPWGFSESGYGILNLELHYQYRAFGVPGLGLRRGLAEDYVVAPYASMLALMVDPVDSLKNLQIIKKEGGYSTNGFYEAIDYTPGRNENTNGDGEKTIVKMYMAHHQGMSLLALANVLDSNIIQNLFHNHPLIQSCELLLQERIPRGIPVKEPRPIDVELEPAEEEKAKLYVDHAGIDDINDTPPRTHILSNGRYSTLITHTGTGYSSYQDTMLTRWRPDVVTDSLGFFFYVRDLKDNEFWSVGHQPVGRKADRYDSWYHAGKVQMARVDNWIESFMEVCVSPEDDIELRKITLTNYSNRPRELDITSYAETVLNDQQADLAHPAFSNLFVQTEYVREHHAILAKRRPRKKDEDPVWLVHTIASEDIEEGHNVLQIESDRKKFIGRNRTLKDPAAMDPGGTLSGSVGNVPDPIVSIRRTITLKPGEKKYITYGLGRANTREEAITMADRYDNPYATDRVFELTSIYGQVELEHIGLSGEQLHYFQKMAGYLLFNCEDFRASEGILKRNRRVQSGLWVHGISGDVPILVYHIDDTKYIREVALLLKAHALWRLKGLKVDLVFINDHPPSYIDELQEAIHQQIQLSMERQRYREKGGVFVLRADELNPDDRTLIEAVARFVLRGKLPKLRAFSEALADFNQTKTKKTYRPVELQEQGSREEPDHSDLLFFNGYGGFTPNGKEYVIRISTDGDQEKLNHPPAPWINVIANPELGFITTESGSDHTWSQNSRENKLTPWSNDTVMDPTGEALYIRDEENRLFWSPTPGPVPGSSQYEIKHGFGYTNCKSKTLNIEQQVTKWVAKEDPIKIIKLRLSNIDLMSKRVSVFRYLDWVLGIFQEETTRHVITSFDKDLQTIFARNHYNNEFSGRVAFAGLFTENAVSETSFTADRAEFIGRNRSLNNPKILFRKNSFTERFGIGFEACAASEQIFDLDSGENAELYFFLGETASEDETRQLIQKYRNRSVIENSLKKVQAFWNKKLSRIQVNTPVPEYNLLANGWLQYQNIACRMWARTGFYQSGGAYGFRDQLQDSTAACYLDPDLSREQILLHAAHQFPEGDVLHWWHPPTDRGIRSRISDDLLWLPYVTAFYLNHTGDNSILSEKLPFVTARFLQDQEHEAYLHPQTTEEKATLYEHCCRAIDRSLTSGTHGLPLIGSGDWNDGMNNVGEQGKGESVWLGFFLYDILSSFIPICRRHDDQVRAENYKTYRKNLKSHLNKEGWDGEWYRRAFYDDGTPLGSSENRECKIDAIAQAWSVISGAGHPQKTQKAMESADKFLVREQEGIIRLLTPAFDKTPRDPGYIKGYIPGVRENGGQYTHAALWLIKALAELGNRKRASRLMQMLTPINHSGNIQDAAHYSVEPYAVAADIYGEPPLTGMGGWTWYTGSAGWMYRVMLESILGISIEKENTLHVSPFVSPDWRRYDITVRSLDGETEYQIEVRNPQKLAVGHLQVNVDGKEHTAANGVTKIRMKKDGKNHHVEIAIVQQ